MHRKIKVKISQRTVSVNYLGPFGNRSLYINEDVPVLDLLITKCLPDDVVWDIRCALLFDGDGKRFLLNGRKINLADLGNPLKMYANANKIDLYVTTKLDNV